MGNYIVLNNQDNKTVLSEKVEKEKQEYRLYSFVVLGDLVH
jgi:hypothetical protein